MDTCPHVRITCTTCALRPLCLPPGLSSGELLSAEHLVSTRLRIRRGGALYRTGDPFKSLYVVWLGCLKSTVAAEDAREQVIGFHMAGEMIGFDGVGAESHSCDMVALEDAEVCVIPYNRVEEAAELAPVLRRHFYALMGREIVRQHELMLMLGALRADERLATFLLDLSDRFDLRGYSSKEFVLRMSRAEIGSFLGLTLETICRLLSQFVRDGLIGVQHAKTVTIADRERLGRLARRRKVARPERELAPAAAARPRLQEIGSPIPVIRTTRGRTPGGAPFRVPSAPRRAEASMPA